MDLANLTRFSYSCAICLLVITCRLIHGQSSVIISESKNLTVELNDIVQLPCLVQQTDSSIVIWQQCEDSNCNELRTPVTIGKENFIQDLRYRLLFESETDQNVVNWMLEIRRFSRNDEACYECQLNKIKGNKIHYCLKVKPKLLITSKPESVKLNHQIKIECSLDEIVHLEKLKWYKNGVKLHVHSHHPNNMIIEKRHSNDFTFTFLVIKHFRKSDEGTYTCKYDNIVNQTVNVFLNDGLKEFEGVYQFTSSKSSSIIDSFLVKLVIALFLLHALLTTMIRQ